MALDFAISDETIALVRAVKQAQQQRAGINSQTGFNSYLLEAPAKAIVPVITPLRNMLPRRPGKGAPSVNWKAITSFDTNRALGTLNEGAVPTSVNYNVVNMNNLFATIALSNSVTFQAQWRARGLEADLRARRTAELLYQLMMVEERWLLTASQYLMPPALPILTTSTSGGTVAAGTYWVQVTAMNANGESIPTALPASSAGSPPGVITTTGSTSTITIQIFTVPNAATYNVYIGSGSSKPANAAMYLQSSLSGSNAPQPSFNTAVTLASGNVATSAEAQGPIITLALTAAPATGTANPPTTNGAKTSVDSTTSAINIWDGLMSQALLNATSGNTLGATVVTPAANTGIFVLSDIDNMLLAMYQQAAGDPDIIVMNPIAATRISNLLQAANGQTRITVEANSPEQSALAANYRITQYINKVTGKAIPIVEDRYCPVDVILAVPIKMPFPSADVPNAVEIETNQEYWGVDFAVTSSQFQFADYLESTLKVYFLGGLGMLRGCYPSI